MRIFLTILIIFFTTIFFVHAEIKNFDNFKSIPVLEGGRIKPLDTYARNLLTQFSGRDHVGRQKATAWLAKLLFTPEATKDDKVILINNPEIVDDLKIPVEAHRRYSFAQFQKVYPKLLELHKAAQHIPEKERSIVENEILRVFENVRLYAELSHEMQFAYPHADFTVISLNTKRRLKLPLDQDQFSFLDIALRAREIREATHGLENKSPSNYTEDEAELLQSTANLFHWALNYKNLSLSVIPFKSNQGENWLSPWDAMEGDFSNEKTRQLIVLWSNMANSYVKGKGVEFDMAAHSYTSTIQKGLSKEQTKSVNKFFLELLYNVLSPFSWSIMFYIMAFIFFISSFTSSKPIWYRLALGCVFGGFALHLLGLAMRIIIMARPPVTNLYETFIFVGFITVFLGLLIEHYNRQWLGIVTAAISGTALLFIANKYSMEGDTLKMLIAVLNSNFWLATHVTTITMGYGATCVGGVLGHIWLIQAAFKKDSLILDKTYKTTLGILGVALSLTFLGTNLGGIWADQSWGRFWGWDPKENGALMIVIWTAMLFHAKIAKLIGPKGLAVGAVIGMIVVMWAWFGVNILSVGLHSYGFTSGIATSLLIYCFCEIIFLLVTTWSSHKKSS